MVRKDYTFCLTSLLGVTNKFKDVYELDDEDNELDDEDDELDDEDDELYDDDDELYDEDNELDDEDDELDDEDDELDDDDDELDDDDDELDDDDDELYDEDDELDDEDDELDDEDDELYDEDDELYDEDDELYDEDDELDDDDDEDSYLFNLIKKCIDKIKLSNLGNFGKKINTYLKEYKNKLIMLKRNKFGKKTEKLYNSNVFNGEKKEKKEDKLDNIRIEPICSFLEEIEYLLMMLSDEERELYKNKYDNLLKNTSSNIKDSELFNFINLKAEIELKLLFSKRNGKDIFECLNSYKIDYLNMVGTNKKTNITFDEINCFFSLFDKTKNNYDILSQRKIINDFAFIYLMEIYENRDSITLDDLENTYINNIIKSIVIIIKSLTSNDIGLFKKNLELELSNNIGLEELLNIIKKLELNIENKDMYLESLNVKKQVLSKQGM